MKFNAKQIQKIDDALLKEDKIYDKLVRLELVDHIASVLEEENIPFDDGFKEYWHSKEKILLITSAKKQIENKKEQVESYFWKQFLKPIHVLIIAVLFFVLRSVFLQIEIFEQFVKASIIVLMSSVLFLFLSIRFFSKHSYYYFKSFLNSIAIFYVVSLQLSNFWRDVIVQSHVYQSVFMAYICLIITSFWFFYKTFRFSKTIDDFKVYSV